MDGAFVLDGAGALWVREGRRVRHGERVAIGSAEDGTQGIYVYAGCFATEDNASEFKFMTSHGVTREADRICADGSAADQ